MILIKLAATTWFILTLAGAIWFFRALPGEDSIGASTVFLPGETTHGHHQIEMQCAICHDPVLGVTDQSCIDCHQAELKASRDTHPKSKFKDPTKAVLLAKIDATNCLTCHIEHDEDKTHPMGVTIESDYCFHCHEDIGKDRPSHKTFAFSSCANSGCHNYHDNTALYENFLHKHLAEPSVSDEPLRKVVLDWAASTAAGSKSLSQSAADPPKKWEPEPTRLATLEWSRSAHAAKGVNCSGCHQSATESNGKSANWKLHPEHTACEECHRSEMDGFLAGHHGMRLAADLPAMTPAQARLPMHSAAGHKSLNCSSCHSPHEPDLKFAAYDACISCHDDQHTRSYTGSAHQELWLAEVDGTGPRGSGVSCATCHMPRTEDGVQHNQNANLRPNEKMIRTVCMNCHGLQFTIDALSDPTLKDNCYSSTPTKTHQSLDMVKDWFESRKKKKSGTK